MSAVSGIESLASAAQEANYLVLFSRLREMCEFCGKSLLILHTLCSISGFQGNISAVPFFTETWPMWLTAGSRLFKNEEDSGCGRTDSCGSVKNVTRYGLAYRRERGDVDIHKREFLHKGCVVAP